MLNTYYQRPKPFEEVFVVDYISSVTSTPTFWTAFTSVHTFDAIVKFTTEYARQLDDATTGSISEHHFQSFFQLVNDILRGKWH